MNGLDDKRWFSKEDLPIDPLENWLPLLEAYYIPCKAKRYLHGEINQSKIITILRHLLKAHEIELKTQEKVIHGKKITLYQVLFYNPNPVVSFD